MRTKNRNQNGRRHSLKKKISLAMMSIAAILVISGMITFMEYKRMSTYVSDLVADDIEAINISQELTVACDQYNLDILNEVGKADSTTVVMFDQTHALAGCDSLAAVFARTCPGEHADKVNLAYGNFAAISKELPQIIIADFIDSREWFFEKLQPEYMKLTMATEEFNAEINADLKAQSDDFQAGYYRCIVPGIVSVLAGLVLILLLLFFILTDYVKPIYNMLDCLENYSRGNGRYGCSFDGDDQLAALNSGIADIIEENQELKRRIRIIKEGRSQQES